MFIKILKTALLNLLVEGQDGKVYHQACSPDIANLYYVNTQWEVKDLPKMDMQNEPVLVINTVFNDVQENFNIHELGGAMIQTIWTYTNKWRSRDAEFGEGPETENLIETPDIYGEGMNQFLAKFSGNSFWSLLHRERSGHLWHQKQSCLCLKKC